MFLLVLIAISFTVFLSQPKEVPPAMVFNKPKVNIDMAVFDSDHFKNLQPFTDMGPWYSYKAVTKDNKPKTGFISADSVDDAKVALESNSLVVTELKEVQPGRDNPFVPYEVAPPAPTPPPPAKPPTKPVKK